MIKPPLAKSIATALTAVIAIQPVLFTMAHGQSAESAAQREMARRKDYERRGEEAIEAGNKAMRDKDYEAAVSQFKLAKTIIPNAPKSNSLYADAMDGYCKASCLYAEQRISEGRYGDATAQLKLVLQDNPRCKRAVVLLSRLETPDYYNQTIGPKFRGKVEQVKQYFVDAKGYMDTGRYDLAMKRTDQILTLDPYNIAAREMQERINLHRNHQAEASANESRSRALWRVQKAWESPVRNFAKFGGDTIYGQGIDESNTAKINTKLQTIILPKLEFREATIREALDYLRRKSVELDVRETDPSKRGVSFVLKLEGATGGGGAPAPGVPAPAVPAIPGLEPIPGAAPAPAPEAAAPSFAGVSPADARITISLTNIPMMVALGYVTSLAGLKFKVEPYAVSIVPQNVDTNTLIPREFKVPPGFITRIAAPGGDAGAGLAPATPGDATRGGASIMGKLDAAEFLRSSGVTFPEGATAVFIAATSRLIVRNTQENLDTIEQIIQATQNSFGPSQVDIEAKFVEITQNNLKELSFDWLLGAANIPGSGGGIFGSGGTSGTAPATSATDFPFVAPGGVPVGTNPVTAGNRSGGLAISQNAIDALLFGMAGSSPLAPGLFALSGVFTDPSYQLVIRALNQKKGVDLLSAPRVTTKSGQRAVIEIIREFRYPTEFDPPQIPQNFGSTGGFSVIGGATATTTSSSGSFPVTPTTPTAFDTRNTGVTLEVEPVVGPDGYTIDLNLVPQVVEFEGFINYGSPIQTTSTDLLGRTTVNVITPNVINQPIFSTRKVTTSVTVFDGQTVVLGGLMREDVQKVEDKTPLLGDIPLVGRLFRSNVDQHIKRNLVIFVSARLINPAGELVRSDEELEEEIKPEPVPEAQVPLLDSGFQK